MNSYMKTVMKCPECPYDKPRNMGTHLFFVHGYSKPRISEWRMNMKAETLSRSRDLYDIFRCQFCPKTYRRQNSCRAHERVVHCVSFSTRQKCVPCPIPRCTFTTTALLDLCAHAKESHGQLGDFSIREARFENLSQFQAWRLQYEENTQTVLATESVNSNAAAGTTLRYLRCAQLEAQIRKVRNQLRQSEARASGRMVEVDLSESELAGEEEEEEEVEVEEGEEEGYGSDQKGYGRRQKKAKDGEEEEGEGEQEEQEGAKEEEAASGPRRSPRKRRMTVTAEEEGYGTREGEEEEGYGSTQKGYGRRQKKAKEEKEERQGEGEEGEEEEEVDVEELDDSEEPGPSTSAAAAAASIAAKKRALPPPRPKVNYEDPEDGGERAPRLLRASSAHLADAELAENQDENEEGQTGQPMAMPPTMYEAEKRMNSRHCTAHMRVLILRTGTVHVEYCSSHLGHDVIPLPPASRPTDRRAMRVDKIKPSSSIAQEIEADIERAKQRRKGRRETEHRWRTESRMRTERAQFSQLLDSYDDIGANVELYEGEDGEVYDEEDLQVEEVIEEEVVDQEELVETDNQ